MLAGLLLLLFLLLVPGWLITSLLFQRVQKALDIWEAGFFTLVFGIGLVSWIGLLLAEFGLYSVTRVALGTGTVSILMGALAIRLRIGLRPKWRIPSVTELTVGLILIAIAGFFYAFPADSVRGGRDWGIYTATAHLLNHTGSLIQAEPQIAAINPEYLGSFRVPLGFYRVGPAETVPQFFHLYPVTLAIFEGSISGSLFYVTPFIGILCLLGIAAFGRRLAFRSAPFAALLLSLNIGYVWFFRVTYAEGLAQAFLFAGLLAWVIALEKRDSVLFTTAGALIGFTLLTKIDALTTLGPIGLAFIYSWLSGRVTFKETLATLSGLAVVTTHALIHGFTLARPYTVGTISILATRTADGGALKSSTLMFAGVVAVAAGLVMGLIVYVLGTRYGRRMTAWIEGQNWIPTALGVSLAVAAGYGLYVRPVLFPTPPGSTYLGAYDVEAFQHFGWYMTQLGIWMALGGLFVYLRRFDARALPFVAAAVFVALASFYRPNIYADHFWQTRRFVLIIFPAFALFAAYLLETIWQRHRLWRLPVVITALVLVMMTAHLGLPFVFHRDYLGLSRQLEELAEKTREADYVVLAKELQAYTVPLRYLYNRPVVQIGLQPKVEQLGKQIDTWLKDGRHVMLLSSSDFLGSGMGNLYFEPKGFQIIEVPYAEVTYERPPRQVLTMRQAVSIYRLVPQTWTPEQFDFAIGALEDVNAPISGVYAREGYPQNPFRWTTGQLTVDLSGLSTGSSYAVSLDMCGHRSTAEKQARVHFNGVTISEFTVEEACRTYRISIPESQVQNGENILSVSLPTFVPAQLTSQSTDRRELGMRLRRITMRPVDPSQVTVEDLLAGHTTQGFFGLERNSQGPFVWLMGTAEFLVEVQPSSRSLILHMGSGRPAGIPQPQVRVYIDGKWATEFIPGTSEYVDYQVPLPAAARRVQVRIETDTWSPAKSGKGKDTRELGIALQQVRLSE